MRILVLNGPNLNLLGIREPAVYGDRSFAALEALIRQTAEEIGAEVELFQSNHEGDLVDRIQQALHTADGILINPAAYTHTSVAILDALRAVGLPTAEVHLSDISQREPFRQFSYVSLYAQKVIVGKGFDGYREGLIWLSKTIGKETQGHAD